MNALFSFTGVAAWAVSADVVMNSGSNNRGNKADSSMMQVRFPYSGFHPQFFEIDVRGGVAKTL